MSKLFDSFQMRGLSLSNRIVIAPMCQYSAVNGNATDWHMALFNTLALSGAGLYCIEATAVSPEGRITPGCLGLWSDENEEALARVLRVVRAVSTIPMAIQLGHAGRKGSSQPPWQGGQLILPDQHGGWWPEGPSAEPHKPDEPAPRELTLADLDTLTNRFVQAAERAVRLGFDAIEVHAAHGYLLHQFLSPIANKRVDQYGGTLENRMRFPLQVFNAVRRAVPDHIPVGIRVSATDWVDDEPSWTLEQTIAFGHAIKQAGGDWIDVSSAGVSPRQRIAVGQGYQVPFAQAIKEQVGLPTMAVGLITEPAQAQAIIAQGQADMVALARGMLYNPRWVWHAAAELGEQVDAPVQFWRALPAGKNAVFRNATFGAR